MAEHTDTLRELLERSTTYLAEGFSVDVSREPAAWDRCLKALGRDAAYARMAEMLCEGYLARFGAPFLFTEKCVAWELKYHIEAFMAAAGYPGYHRHLSTHLFRRAELIEHCRAVDISVADVASVKQRLMFGYRRGIRPCWRGTEKDPFRK